MTQPVTEFIMRHRLYYLLPDADTARQVFNDLLLNRIEQKNIHFMTGGAELPPDLPEANVFHKTDVVHGAESGMLVGVVLVLSELFGLSSEAATVLIATLGGILFGGWTAGMVAAALPNTRLNAFYPEIEKGKVLMILDVPARRIEEIEEVLAKRHPEMQFGGEEPHIPVFP
jgi:hypothetical protein